MLLAALAAALFIYRGPWLSLGDSGDLAVIYASTRVWLAGEDPHNREVYHGTYARTTGHSLNDIDKNRVLSLYPPTVYPVMAPIAVFDWRTAQIIFAAINVVLATAMIAVLPRMAGMGGTTACCWLMLAWAIALAPLHSAIKLGQLSVIATACIILTIILARRDKWFGAGVLLAVAAALKITIALPFAAYFLVRGQRRTVVVTLLGLAVFGAIGAGRLEAAGVDWLGGLGRDLAVLTAPGGYGDPSVANHTRHQLMNLQYPLHNFIDNHAAVRAITYGFTGLAALMTIAALHRQRQPDRDLLGLSMVGVLSMLVTYHRIYDMIILVLPLAWAFDRWRSGRRRLATVVMLILACFLLPITGIVKVLEKRGDLPASLVSGDIWRMLVLPHEVWALLLLVFVMMYALIADRRTELPATT